MTKDFKSTYDESEVFYLRADLLRPMFGHWDAEDPVSHAILDIVEAQRELSDAIADYAMYAYLSSDAAEKAIKAAVEKRHAAGERLLQALEDRDNWPEPELGQR